MEFIRRERLGGSPKNKITVVFDGYSDIDDLSAIKARFDIEVTFTKKETADERIRKMTEDAGNPKNIVVVSDDREIKFFVKSAGARSIGVEEFINSKENLKKQQGKDSLKPELTYSQIHKINQELKKIWLK